MFFDELADSVVTFKDPRAFIKQAGRFEERGKVNGDLFPACFFKDFDGFFKGFLVTGVTKKFEFIFGGNSECPVFGKTLCGSVWFVPRSDSGVGIFSCLLYTSPSPRD